MVALLILGILIIYMVSVWLLIRLAKKSKTKDRRVFSATVAVILVLAPIWDVPLNNYRKQKLCENEAGIVVYQKLGLSEKYFLNPGEKTKKLVAHPDSNPVLRVVPATGEELDMEEVERRFQISYRADDDYVSWGKVLKYIIEIREGDILLSRAVAFTGGGGWFHKNFSWSPGYGGQWCPPERSIPDGLSYEERLFYSTFFKDQN